ncbi:C-type lectin lectoxin-Lio3-like, partial [Anneissia japonica]|uniref:C-type lectin lectoxin-Lio3-like n=1 Tax=Anneissia japonica TaxID=1529436 RepID=UPI0014258E79
CAEFFWGSSLYQATFVEANSYSEFKSWNEVQVLCQQTDCQLVSITTLDENNAILNSLENCTYGDYAIGLSRQMGKPKGSASSWNWESGETVNLLNWGNYEPNLQDSKSTGVYMTTLESYVSGKWHDLENTERIGLNTGSPGYGYICEKSVI